MTDLTAADLDRAKEQGERMTTTTIAGTEIDAAIATLKRISSDLTSQMYNDATTTTDGKATQRRAVLSTASQRWIAHAVDCLWVAAKHQQQVAKGDVLQDDEE